MNQTIITATVSRLIRAENNVRVTRTGEDFEAKIEAMAASIKAQGLLQNLIGYELPDGRIAVAGGGRRLAALSRLVERGELAADFPISVKIIPAEQATAASLSENVQREQMHPADEFDAFRSLTEQGWSVDRIADAFGVTPLVVERRLRLMQAAPSLIEEFRNGGLTTDQLIALCATEDHARQVAVWDRYRNNSWCTPKDIRRAVIDDGEVDASRDTRVAFIGGLDAYRAAGGAVRADLFQGDGEGGFITDIALLDELVTAKLEETAEAVRAEGWGWVEVWAEYDYNAANRLGQVAKPGRDSYPQAVKDALAALESEEDALRAEQDELLSGDDELTEAQTERDSQIDARLSQIEDEVSELEKANAVYAPEVMAVAGAVVARSGGTVRIDRGMVRAADRKAVAEVTGAGAVAGGRETESAGRKAGGVSEALRKSLLRQRNIAVQTEVAMAPNVAKILLACWAVEQVHGVGIEAPIDLSIADGWRGTRVLPASDADTEAKIEGFRAHCAEAVKGYPKSGPALWDALAKLSGEELDAVIAVGVAASVSVTEGHKGMTAKMLDALGFDMANHFTPTAVNYLGRVPGGLILEALTEAGKVEGKDDRAKLEAMKKGALVVEAEARLNGAGWVPKGIRTPKAKPKAAAKPKADAGKSAPKGKGKGKKA